MFFVWISEQTAIISLYGINLSVFKTEAECLLRGTKWVFKLDRYSFVLKGFIQRIDRERRLSMSIHNHCSLIERQRGFSRWVECIKFSVCLSSGHTSPLILTLVTRW